MKEQSIIPPIPELYKNGELDFKAAEAYMKKFDKIVRDIGKVLKVMEKVGRDRARIEELLGKKYKKAEAERLVELYTRMMNVTW